MLQNTYAVSIARLLTTMKTGALEAIVERRKKRQVQTAPYLNQQLIFKVLKMYSMLYETMAAQNGL